MQVSCALFLHLSLCHSVSLLCIASLPPLFGLAPHAQGTPSSGERGRWMLQKAGDMHLCSSVGRLLFRLRVCCCLSFWYYHRNIVNSLSLPAMALLSLQRPATVHCRKALSFTHSGGHLSGYLCLECRTKSCTHRFTEMNRVSPCKKDTCVWSTLARWFGCFDEMCDTRNGLVITKKKKNTEHSPNTNKHLFHSIPSMSLELAHTRRETMEPLPPANCLLFAKVRGERTEWTAHFVASYGLVWPFLETPRHSISTTDSNLRCIGQLTIPRPMKNGLCSTQRGAV